MEKLDEKKFVCGSFLLFYNENKLLIKEEIKGKVGKKHPEITEIIDSVLADVEKNLYGICLYASSEEEFIDRDNFIARVCFYWQQNIKKCLLINLSRKSQDLASAPTKKKQFSFSPLATLFEGKDPKIVSSEADEGGENSQVKIVLQKGDEMHQQIKNVLFVFENKLVEFFRKTGLRPFPLKKGSETDNLACIREKLKIKKKINYFGQCAYGRYIANTQGDEHDLIVPQLMGDMIPEQFARAICAFWRLKMAEEIDAIFCQPKLDPLFFSFLKTGFYEIETARENKLLWQKIAELKNLIKGLEFSYDLIVDLWAHDFMSQEYPELIQTYWQNFRQELSSLSFYSFCKENKWQIALVLHLALLKRRGNLDQVWTLSGIKNEEDLSGSLSGKEEGYFGFTEKKEMNIHLLAGQDVEMEDVVTSLFERMFQQSIFGSMGMMEKYAQKKIELGQQFLKLIALLVKLPKIEVLMKNKVEAVAILEKNVQAVFAIMEGEKTSLGLKQISASNLKPEKQPNAVPVAIVDWPKNPILTEILADLGEEKDEIETYYAWSRKNVDF